MVGFGATETANYCGLGNEVSCSVADAERAAGRAGLRPGTEGFERFVDRYHLYRSMKFTTTTTARLRPFASTKHLELSLRWSARLSRVGFFGEDGPFENSLYAIHRGDADEGLLHALEFGLTIDHRDDELQPTRGWIAGAHLRHALEVLGSQWGFVGTTASLGGYVPIIAHQRLVWATRGIMDLIVGDAPLDALASVGGVWPTKAFGGAGVGRGVRAQRNVGRIKGLVQSELRSRIWGFDGGLALRAQTFVDAGWIGVDWDEFGGDPKHLLVGYGGGLGLSWGRSFLLRFDLGFSPEENHSPQVYLSIGQPY